MTVPRHDDPDLVTHEHEPHPDPGVQYQRTALAEFLQHIAGKSEIHRTQHINERGINHA